jgi:UPF0755 protein
MDIKPPRPRKPVADIAPVSVPAPQPINTPVDPPVVSKKKMKKSKKIILFSILGFFVLVIAFIVSAFVWYNVQLSPVNAKDSELVKVTIAQNTSPKSIAAQLKDEGVIRSTEAFSLYTRLTGVQNSLKAGSYRLSPSESTPEIVKHLTNGTVDTFNITFYPGATVAENKKVLTKAGYSEAEVDKAFSAAYDSPLFNTKPASADFEGYIYGETYNFSTDATVEDILGRTFSQFLQVIEENGLTAKFQSHGLTLYQGIILASIVQRESIKGDEPQIAQVFYSRLALNMELGSDVTYQYIADKTGVARDPNLDSPYNTRRYPGLPPGPIATPGLGSLLAVANPASGDYLFFLSGDDDVTYYGRTLSEHEANIAAHCKVKCSIL